MKFRFRSLVAASAGVALLLIPCATASADSVFLTIGDSFAWGQTTQINPLPSDGDQGYVRPFADALAAARGGVRPTVVNLAIVGESTNSFFSGVTADPFPAVYPYPAGLVDAPLRDALLNTHYTSASVKQRDAAIAAIAASHAVGDTVDNIVVQIGGNDLLELLIQQPFLDLALNPDPVAQQQVNALLTAQFGNLQTNYATLLGTLRAAAPEARVFTIGYENSFRGLPFGDFTDGLTLNANAVIQGVSQAFGAKYVDIYTPFFGREAELTYSRIEENNPHPTAAGYAVIAQTLQGAAAPEPSSVALLALVLPIAVVVARRRA